MKTPVSLLERLRRPGQEQAWERFVEPCAPLLYYWARRTTLPNVDPSDLVQEVLTLLVRKLPEFNYDRNRNFRAWLRTVAQNCWRNLMRRAELLAPPMPLAWASWRRRNPASRSARSNTANAWWAERWN